MSLDLFEQELSGRSAVGEQLQRKSSGVGQQVTGEKKKCVLAIAVAVAVAAKFNGGAKGSHSVKSALAEQSRTSEARHQGEPT